MLKRLSQYIIQIIVTSILVVTGSLYMNGIPLLGVPKIDDILYVQIAHSTLGVTGRQLTEAEDIEKAINLTNFLKHTLRKPEQGDPIVELTLRLRDGEVFVIGANEDSLFKNGKAYSLKDDAGTMYIKLNEAIFFFADLVAGNALPHK